MRSRITPDREAIGGEVTFEGPTLVLTEGEDDALLVVEVAKAYGLDGIQAHVMFGKDTGWSAAVKFIRRHPTFVEQAQALGLVRDADSSGASALQSCRDVLTHAGFDVPAQSGSIAVSLGKRVGVFIVPGDDKRGAIEDLVLAAADEPRLVCVDKYLDCLARKELSGPANLSKGRMQAYLAGLPAAPKTLATAIRKGCFDWRAEAFRPLASWLASLAAVDLPGEDD